MERKRIQRNDESEYDELEGGPYGMTCIVKGGHGNNIMMSRSLRKWCLSRCSLVKMSEGLSFPPMWRILTLLLKTASLEALSRIWMWRMALLFFFWTIGCRPYCR